MKGAQSKRSKGAVYVRKLRHSLLMWDEDGTAKLLWSPGWAVFVSATGETRKIYGLACDEAKAICTLKGVQFFDQSKAPSVR